MPKKTVLLVFVHGFKGGDDTFDRFPPHLQALLSHALPNFNIVQTVYPQFETRGELKEAVANFREWLQNKVIDLEVASNTPSPTVDPSVRSIIIGHSMGGIVGAETILSIVNDQPVKSDNSKASQKSSYEDAPDVPFMFPSILGLLAFDTPYLGLSPGVIAHGAESHFQNIKGAWSAYNTVSNVFNLGGASPANTVNASKALPAPSTNASSMGAAAGAPAWQKWGKYAMYAGAASAVIAGGAAAYANRAQISEGWSWATSHLAFVGCLARGAELEQRVAGITELTERGGFGFQTMFTQLGAGAGTLVWKDDSKESGGSNSGDGGAIQQEEAKDTWAHALAGPNRTFCLLPKDKTERRKYFVPTVNDKATSEIGAHMNMFTPKDNPGYYAMSEAAKTTIAGWVTGNWYAEESGERNEQSSKSQSQSQSTTRQRTLFERRRDSSEEPEEHDGAQQAAIKDTPELIDLTDESGHGQRQKVKKEELETNPWA